jgi:hypothetical protein
MVDAFESRSKVTLRQKVIMSTMEMFHWVCEAFVEQLNEKNKRFGVHSRLM